MIKKLSSNRKIFLSIFRYMIYNDRMRGIFMSKNDHDLMMIEIKNQFRINELIRSIKKYNNQSEYFRLKYYSNLIIDLRLLNQYENGVSK